MSLAKLSRPFLTALFMLTSALGVATSVAAPAQAADTGTITSISASPSTLRVGEQLAVTANFLTPASARAGDTFSVSIPTRYVVGRSSTFQAADNAGNIVAKCVVSNSSVVCTYTSFVESHSNVTGTIRFTTIANATNAQNGLDWVDGAGKTFHTNTVIISPGGYPQRLAKNGEALPNGDTRYYSGFPGSVLSPNYTTWFDTYDSRYTLLKSSIIVQYSTPSQGWTTMDPSTYTVSFNDAYHQFSVALINPTRDNSKAYRMIYDMRPQAGLANETKLSNGVAAGTQTFGYTYTYLADSGSGSGTGGTLTWTKVNPSGALLPGATFRLTGPRGFNEQVADNQGLDVDPAAGKFSVGGLAAGQYTLTEVTAPTGYQVSTAPVTVRVTAGQSTSAGAVVNSPLAQPSGSLTWSKVNANNSLLAGAEWTLTGPGGVHLAITDNGTRDTNPKAGEFTVTNLPLGQYSLVETKAPAGYVKDTTTHHTILSSDHQTTGFGAIINTPTPASGHPSTGPSTSPKPTATATNPTTPAAAERPGPQLAYTGANAGLLTGWTIAALGLVGTGVIMLMAQRRKRR